MRKLIISLSILVLTPVLGRASVTASSNVVNDTGLAYSNNYDTNLNKFAGSLGSASRLSAQITYSSATLPSKTFTDGTQSTGSLTVVSTAPLVAAQATNSITVPSTALILGAAATAQITISSAVPGAIISINGNQLREGIEWIGVGLSTTAAATNLSAAINTYLASTMISTAPAGSKVIYATATTRGTFGNSYTLTSSTPSTTGITTTTWSGGLNRILTNDVLTINGVPYLNGYLWTDASNTSTGTAASITTLLGKAGGITATTNGVSSVIYATATVAGTAGNSLTLAASAGLTIGSANFTGGRDNAYITINGTTLTLGTSWDTPTASSTTANVATAIAAAINANSTLAPLITAFASGNIITSTSDVNGASTNYTTVSSTQSQLSFSNATMTGGTDPGYSLTTELITIPSHGFTKALPVLLSTGGATIGPLVNQTTYYVVVIDANNIGLSSTSAVAQTGNYINLTSSSTQSTGHTLTLAPGTFIQGPTAAKWQVSNDGTNWADYSVTSANIAVSSQTFTAVYPSTTVVQDFGLIDYGYLRYNVTGPTQGAVNLKVILNSKD